ncbi:ABC transporter substrate-binding protein [Streptomyces sp. IBSBF 3136]|uniref:ABC transporter substrate-binding protein n=1 Tax=Streptomyces sp. IBSBF 3136 TaxID=2903524 RepID=UPI003FA71B75
MRKTTVLRAAAAATAALLTMTACSSRRGQDDTDTAAGGACKGQQTTGITDRTITLGGIYPLSGPASAYGTISKGVAAYFRHVNDKGGIDGRKVRFIVRDDGYQPPKAVEEARRLVEQEKVFAVFQTLGTPSTAAVWDYLNQQKVPQPFVATGASVWGTDDKHPWTIGWQPNYVAEARVYAKYLKDTRPKAKVAVLYQNDDFGKDLLGGFEKAVAGSGVKVVAAESYEVTDPSVSAQMASLARSGADVLLDVTTPKFGSQALAADARNTRWNPLHIVNNVASSAAVLKPVGFKNVQGVVSATYFKDPADPQWANDPDVKTYKEALHAVYDPVSGRCSMARAGHPPPVVTSPDGQPAPHELPAGPPLGLGGLPFEARDVELAEGSLLCLYTNGLIGERHIDADTGLAKLCEALTRPADALERTCQAVVDSLVPAHPADDVALLIARTRMLPPDDVASWCLPPEPASAARARELTSAKLTEWGLEHLAFTTELIVSELVTNVYRYASGPATLRLIRERSLVCEVSDTSHTSPHLRRARTTDEGGRGLFLVAQMTERWGTRYTRDGKTVWTEQSLTGMFT